MQTLAASTTIDTVYCIMQQHVLQYTHHVKYGRFRQAAKALVTAYSKEFLMKVAEKHIKYSL